MRMLDGSIALWTESFLFWTLFIY